MKKTFTFIKYIALGTLCLIGAFAGPTFASAGWTYQTFTIPYQVQGPGSLGVTLTADPASMTLPTNQTVLTWSITGNTVPDSCVGSDGSSGWPGSKAVSGDNQTMTNLAAGTYNYTITCSRGTLSATAQAVVTVDSGIVVLDDPTAWLNVNPNTCVISDGSSTCTVTGATWGTTNIPSVHVVDDNTNAVLSTLTNNSTPMQVWVAYPHTVYLLQNQSDGSILDSKIAYAVCRDASTWDGSKCVAGSTGINGQCSATHFQCNIGTSINQSTGVNSWTWQCAGTQHGSTTASCSEQMTGGGGGGGGTSQCSDGIDNDNDGLIDADDPSCHTDCGVSAASGAQSAQNAKDLQAAGDQSTLKDQGDAKVNQKVNGSQSLSSDTYDPTLNNEAKRCSKPVYIEI